jgi:hypothetical protein
MLRPVALLAPIQGYFFTGLQTLGSLHQLPDSCEVTWLLPRPDSHRLVVPRLARRAQTKKPSYSDGPNALIHTTSVLCNQSNNSIIY